LKTYKPGFVPNDPAQLPGFLRQEQNSLVQAANAAQPFVLLQVLHAEPPRMLPGMVIYADGADLDPGSGEGVYVRDKANAAWRYLG
jgi:hypothetical protein